MKFHKCHPINNLHTPLEFVKLAAAAGITITENKAWKVLKEYRYEPDRRGSGHRPKSKTPSVWELMDRYCLRKGGYMVYHGFTAPGDPTTVVP